jgi:hypothetical protein
MPSSAVFPDSHSHMTGAAKCFHPWPCRSCPVHCRARVSPQRWLRISVRYPSSGPVGDHFPPSTLVDLPYSSLYERGFTALIPAGLFAHANFISIGQLEIKSRTRFTWIQRHHEKDEHDIRWRNIASRILGFTRSDLRSRQPGTSKATVVQHWAMSALWMMLDSCSCCEGSIGLNSGVRLFPRIALPLIWQNQICLCSQTRKNSLVHVQMTRFTRFAQWSSGKSNGSFMICLSLWPSVPCR